jgi:CheY-like chemotaxis protein/two-component sensor histidine kinase
VDAAERRRAEDALRLEVARKDEFLAVLSHELRNPVGAISNAIALLNRLGPVDPPVRNARDVITRQVAHLTHLVNDLLDVSRLAHGKVILSRKTIDLAPVVSASLDALRPALAERRQELRACIAEGPLFVEGDEVRLAQIVANLVSNASRYSPSGSPVLVALRRDEDEAVLEVTDHGMGIRAELLPKIFDLFVQGEEPVDAAEGGLGIGLNLAARLTRKHGGRIVALSEGPGRGSSFFVHLPLAPPPAPQKGDSGAATAPRERPARKVLIVDDHADSVEGLCALLEMHGHDVRSAGEGAAAFALAKEFRPDVVILDIGLPGLDGYEVARRLRAEPATRSAFLVALTGYGQEEDRRRARDAGFDVHRLKPVDLEQLLALVQEGRPGPARG